MGKYFIGSVQDLLDMGAHVILEPPTTLEKLPDGKALICIIETIQTSLLRYVIQTKE